MKKVIGACIDQLLEFDSMDEINQYKADLERKKQQFKIVNTMKIGGKIQVRIKKQYNNNKFM